MTSKAPLQEKVGPGVATKSGNHTPKQAGRCAWLLKGDLAQRGPDVVMAHWIRQATNAILACLKSVFSAVKRKGGGFRSTEILITILHFTAGRSDIPDIH